MSQTGLILAVSAAGLCLAASEEALAPEPIILQVPAQPNSVSSTIYSTETLPLTGGSELITDF